MGIKIVKNLRTSMGMVALGLLVLSVGAFMVLPNVVKIIGGIALGVGAVLLLIGKGKI